MRVLVTGAGGYIGGKMVEALCAMDWVATVVGTDINESAISYPGYTFYKRDILDTMDDIFDDFARFVKQSA